MNKQTSVEWLVNALVKHDRTFREFYGAEIEQAQAMEREQRFQDFKEGFQAAVDSLQGANNLVQSKKYKGGEQ